MAEENKKLMLKKGRIEYINLLINLQFDTFIETDVKPYLDRLTDFAKSDFDMQGKEIMKFELRVNNEPIISTLLDTLTEPAELIYGGMYLSSRVSELKMKLDATNAMLQTLKGLKDYQKKEEFDGKVKDLLKGLNITKEK